MNVTQWPTERHFANSWPMTAPPRAPPTVAGGPIVGAALLGGAAGTAIGALTSPSHLAVQK